MFAQVTLMLSPLFKIGLNLRVVSLTLICLPRTIAYNHEDYPAVVKGRPRW